MLKVYIGTTPICFVDQTYPIPHGEGVLYSSSDSAEIMLQLVTMVEKSREIKQVLIRHADPETAFRDFRSLFKVIEAAGGLVFSPEEQVLFIFRLGKWDLPKGKIEKGESVEKAALREVSEECGVSGLTIIKPLSPTYHTYTQRAERILKITHWFEMRIKAQDKLTPQTEEGITEAKWMNEENLKQALKNTFPSVRDVVERFFYKP